MKTLLNPWFVAGCLIWLAVFLARRSGHHLPYLNGYLTDAIAVPVIANLGLWFQRQVIIKSNYYVLSPRHVVFIVLAVSLWFEVLLPRYSAVYTADWADVALYILGGLFFYGMMNKPVVE
jgi:hypothetical protein